MDNNMMHIKFLVENYKTVLIASPSIDDFLFQIISLAMTNSSLIVINNPLDDHSSPAVSMYRDALTGKYHIVTYGIKYSIKKRLHKAATVFALRCLIYERTGNYLLTVGGPARAEHVDKAKEIAKNMLRTHQKEKKNVPVIACISVGPKSR